MTRGPLLASHHDDIPVVLCLLSHCIAQLPESGRSLRCVVRYPLTSSAQRSGSVIHPKSAASIYQRGCLDCEGSGCHPSMIWCIGDICALINSRPVARLSSCPVTWLKRACGARHPKRFAFVISAGVCDVLYGFSDAPC